LKGSASRTAGALLDGNAAGAEVSGAASPPFFDGSQLLHDASITRAVARVELRPTAFFYTR
jgi:hypothetical protein